jgi:hypothetical protein
MRTRLTVSEEWETLRKLVLPCGGHSSPMHPACRYCGERWVKIVEAVEVLRDPEVIRREDERNAELRQKIANIPVRRLLPRPGRPGSTTGGS